MANRIVTAAALLTLPIAALSACSSSDQSGEQTSSTSSSQAPPAGAERLTTQLKTADGTPVADASIDFANGFARITVKTTKSGVLSPGFHGMHIHQIGKCEPSSVAPTGGEPGDFMSAGGHFQASGHTGHPASGDLTSLEVRSDGSAELVTTTDAFTAQDLRGSEGSALMIHQDQDNFAHIPDRYSQAGGAKGPDEETLSTGDAGTRVACGVIQAASATTTSSTTTTTTTTTPATVTETTVVSPTVVPPPATETTTTSTSTAVTTTTTVPPTTTTTVSPPPVPGG